MTQADNDGLPMQGEQAEAQLTGMHPFVEHGVIIEEAKPDPNAWIERMKVEHHELDKRGMALTAFMRTDKFKELPARDRLLMEVQQRNMAGYYEVLTERIFRAEHPDMAAMADQREAEEHAQHQQDLRKHGEVNGHPV